MKAMRVDALILSQKKKKQTCEVMDLIIKRKRKWLFVSGSSFKNFRTGVKTGIQ